tara:strand:+ start:857 stop:1312 length:456 start_codon:yes stop_codon:yes gene_type:complete
MNPSKSNVKRKHKRKGGGSKSHSSRGRIGTATIKKRVGEAARRANKRVDKAATSGKGRFSNTKKIIKEVLSPASAIAIAGKAVKENVPKKKKIPTIGSKDTKLKRRPTTKEQRDAGASVTIDWKQLDNPKKSGGRITYKMTGGQVVDSSYD